jgi:dolichol-phosphate mannosyltransferase
MPERHRFLRGMIAWIGYDRCFVEFEAGARAAGESKYTLRKMLALASDAAFSFSTTPIRLASRVGLVITLLGIVYLAYILGRWAIFGDLVAGWASLICTVLILSGFQLTFIGLIGEYLARVFEEAKGRPLYLFKQKPQGEEVPAPVAARVQQMHVSPR